MSVNWNVLGSTVAKVQYGGTDLFARSVAHERVSAGVIKAFCRGGNVPRDALIVLPPIIPGAVLERAEYSHAFPQLLGGVSTLSEAALNQMTRKDARAGHKEWLQLARTDEMMLPPAACYFAYSQSLGTRAEAPQAWALVGECHRREITFSETRLRSFRMLEFVLVGDEHEASDWGAAWLHAGQGVLGGLGLATSPEAASDPFFGPQGEYIGALQQSLGQKTELVAQCGGRDVALASANTPGDHFGKLFDIRCRAQPAHTSCFAVGLDRVVAALVEKFGSEVNTWPAEIRECLAIRDEENHD